MDSIRIKINGWSGSGAHASPHPYFHSRNAKAARLAPTTIFANTKIYITESNEMFSNDANGKHGWP